MDIKTLFWHSILREIDMPSIIVFSLTVLISNFTPRYAVKKMILRECVLSIVCMLHVGHREKTYSAPTSILSARFQNSNILVV